MSLPTDLDYPSRTNQVAAPSTYTLHATTSQLPHYLRSTPDALFFFTVIYSTYCHVFGRVHFLVRPMQPKACSFETLSVIYDTHHSQHNPVPSAARTIRSPGHLLQFQSSFKLIIFYQPRCIMSSFPL
ncbi:hypothetical protein F4782DRAFT_361230 [Xylaria castorea]|nr:hypothetical protein F4782DRAFT_361230 [Xylaria castorea]